MTLVGITNDNYASFKQSEQAILVAGASWCPACTRYKPVVAAVADLMPNVTFGEAVLDKGHLSQFKRDYPDIGQIPITFGMVKGEDVFRLIGEYESVNELLEVLTRRFALGTNVGKTVYLPVKEGVWIWARRTTTPAMVRMIVDDFYVLELLQNSALGKQSTQISIPIDSEKLPEGLEGKL